MVAEVLYYLQALMARNSLIALLKVRCFILKFFAYHAINPLRFHRIKIFAILLDKHTDPHSRRWPPEGLLTFES